MTRLSPVALAVLSMLGGGTPATAQVQRWQWMLLLQPAANNPAGEQCAVLDADVYARAAPGLRDVRLVQDGREIAYALQESYDESALHIGTSAPWADRSLYTTVLTIPLYSVIAGNSGNRLTAHAEQRGVALLPRGVPVERLELVANAQNHADAAQRDGAHVRFRLEALPDNPSEAALPAERAEVIEDDLPVADPVVRTAIGANLQGAARLSVTVAGNGLPYTALRLQMHQRSICYQPLSASAVTLYLGNAAAQPVRYSYAAHYRPTSNPLLASTGTIGANPAFRPVVKRQFVVTRRLRLLLALAVALLGFLLTAVPLLRRA